LAAVLAALAVLVPVAPAAAVTLAGSFDSSFGTSGYFLPPLAQQTGAVATLVEPNGDLVAVGEALNGSQPEMAAVRLLPNGALDTSFGNGGWTLLAIGKSSIAAAVALQSNGDLVIAGTGGDPTAYAQSLAAVRLTPSGQLDSSFGNRGIVTVPVGYNAAATAVAIQQDGRIVLGGTATTDHNRFVAARLNPDGSLDQSFGNSGIELLGPAAAAWGMALQSNGDIVLAGQQAYNGAQAYMAARLLPNGTPDASFGRAGIVTLAIGKTAVGLAMALQTDGRILVTGNANTGTLQVATARLMPDGSLDPSFGSKGIATFPGSGVNAMALQQNGQIVLAGAGASAIRLNADGSPDLTFGKRAIAFAPIGTHDSANGVAIQSNGMIVLAGEAAISGAMRLSVIRLAG
jgi:uncharacterized delta-60 repeat protein